MLHSIYSPDSHLVDMSFQQAMTSRHAPRVTLEQLQLLGEMDVQRTTFNAKAASGPSILEDDDLQLHPSQGRSDQTTAQMVEKTENPHNISERARQMIFALRTTSKKAESENFGTIIDTGCSAVLSNKLVNCKNCVECTVDILQAEDGAKLQSTHKCMKTYYVKLRNGDTNSLHFEAYFVPGLKHDLISGRAITNELGFQTLLDADDDVSGIFIKHKGKLCGIEYSIPFISEDSSLFRIATLDIV